MHIQIENMRLRQIKVDSLPPNPMVDNVTNE